MTGVWLLMFGFSVSWNVFQNVSEPISSRRYLRFDTLIKAAVLGAASVLVSNASAAAVDTITLKYYGSSASLPTEVTLTLDEIKEFVATGELGQQIREFFDINQQDPGPVQRALTEQIRVPEDFGQNFLESSTGEFVVLQLRKLIQGSEDLTNLRTALQSSIEDDRYISILEVIENYPESEVTLDVTGLVSTYTDVRAFVERILPALEVAKDYLQGVVCDCEQVPTASSDVTQSQLTRPATAQAVNCPETRTAATADSSATKTP